MTEIPCCVTHGALWVEAARRFATAAHQGQVDKFGQPYIDHPRRVAEQFAETDHSARIVAWLHDVVEDTDVDLGDLLAYGYGHIIVTAVDAISRRHKEPSDAYYWRVRHNALALRVKYADIADNSDPDRLAALDEATQFRLMAKYQHALACLAHLEPAEVTRADVRLAATDESG